MIRKIRVLSGGVGILTAAIAPLAFTACDQAPTKTEAPKALTPEEARKIRQDKWEAAAGELEKVNEELATTQDKLENVIEGTEKGDVDELASRLKKLQGRLNFLKEQMSLLGKPREKRNEGEPTPEPHATATPKPASATPGSQAVPENAADAPPPQG